MTPLDLEPIKARLIAAKAPWLKVPMCSVGVTHQWLPPEVEAFCVGAGTDIPALVAEVERLRRALGEVSRLDGCRCNVGVNVTCPSCYARDVLEGNQP